MRTSISSPFPCELTERLRAGDEIALSATVHVVPVDVAAVDGALAAGLAYRGGVDGRVYCFAGPRNLADGDAGWIVAAMDEPAVDRATCALLAAGAQAFIARGPCPATVSYALRKYRGLYFAVGPDWLQQLRVVFPQGGNAPVAARPVLTTFPVDRVPLIVTHDAHGRSVAPSGSVWPS